MHLVNDTAKKLTALTMTIGLILIDLLVKHQIASSLTVTGTRPLIEGVLSLHYVENHGAAFSILSGHAWIFILTAVIFTVVALFFFFKYPYQADLTRVGILLVAGAIGNLYDRVALGYVRDFFRFDFINFPVFNLADVYITMAACIIVFGILFGKHQKASHNEETRNKNNEGE
ncbi:MAG: signal peptidase II [Eubacteriales bacterium]|nr:signal peptidase II [Eubacteriales bacterium]